MVDLQLSSGHTWSAQPISAQRFSDRAADDMVTTTACMRITVDDNVKKTLDLHSLAVWPCESLACGNPSQSSEALRLALQQFRSASGSLLGSLHAQPLPPPTPPPPLQSQVVKVVRPGDGCSCHTSPEMAGFSISQVAKLLHQTKLDQRHQRDQRISGQNRYCPHPKCEAAQATLTVERVQQSSHMNQPTKWHATRLA